MSTFSLSLKALESGTGKSLNVDTVACGRQSEGFNNNLNTFSVPDRFNDMVARYGEGEVHAALQE